MREKPFWREHPSDPATPPDMVSRDAVRAWLQSEGLKYAAMRHDVEGKDDEIMGASYLERKYRHGSETCDDLASRVGEIGAGP